jgi:putative membrane protein
LTGNEQPNVQVELAKVRSELALDRTLLAWIRTSLSLMAFGFGLAKYINALVAKGALPAEIIPNSPKYFGLAMILLAVLGLIGAIFDHFRCVKEMKTDVTVSKYSSALVVALAVASVGALMILNILFSTTTF